jgi:hypothetical protein
MKKLAVLFTALVYLLFTSGLAVNVHYCMGEVDSVRISANPGKICGNCGMHTEESEGCCHDDVHFYKVDDSQQGAHAFAFVTPADMIIPPVYSPIINPVTDTNNEPVTQASDPSPPPLSVTQRLSLYSAYRI